MGSLSKVNTYMSFFLEVYKGRKWYRGKNNKEYKIVI